MRFLIVIALLLCTLLDITHPRQIPAVVLDGQLFTTEALNQLKGE